MNRRKFYRVFWLGIAALLIYGAVTGHASQPAYCGYCGHGSYSTPPAKSTAPAHPLQRLRRAVTRGRP